MPTEPDIVVEESDMVVKRELHTKCVTAGRLSQELKDLLGDAQFKVEVSVSFIVEMEERNTTNCLLRCAITSTISRPPRTLT